jgi:hypothetical protein
MGQAEAPDRVPWAIPPTALGAWQVLQARLDEVNGDVPCRTTDDVSAWWPDKRDLNSTATYGAACRRCALRDPWVTAVTSITSPPDTGAASRSTRLPSQPSHEGCTGEPPPPVSGMVPSTALPVNGPGEGRGNHWLAIVSSLGPLGGVSPSGDRVRPRRRAPGTTTGRTPPTTTTRTWSVGSVERTVHPRRVTAPFAGSAGPRR